MKLKKKKKQNCWPATVDGRLFFSGFFFFFLLNMEVELQSVGIGRVIILDILLTIPMLLVHCSCFFSLPFVFNFTCRQMCNAIIA